ncbi:MAG: protein kinase [Candidatus Zixiibacteriota bacterium]
MLKVGQSLAHFEIVSTLGEGGMGQVYLANDTKLQRQVALKILLPEYFDSSEHLERFEREARTAAKVNHPNVVALYDIGSAKAPESSDTLQYIVMEYVEGEPLDAYLRRKGNSQAEVVRLAEKTAAGLAAAHKMNIVHRDIKAENIIITEEGQPKILDFGLAKPVAPLTDDRSVSTKTVSQELTRAGKILGTVSYMSPEQARGEPVDARSDIFSFGILLYRMATGHLPFSGSSQVSTLARILEVTHDPPSAKVDGIPAEMERIIDKCLQKDVNDRYQDARDLAVDLRGLRRQIDSGISATVSSVSKARMMKGPLSLAGGWKTYVLGLMGLLVVVAVISNMFEDASDAARPGLQARQNSLAILGFTNKTGDEKLAWLETGLPEILLTDLSQSQAISIIGRERVLDCFKDRRASHTHEEYVKKAQSIGATKILSGAYYRLGDKIRIDARLEDSETGQILLAEKVIGEDPFSLVDSLTDKIAQSLNIQGELARTDRVSQFFGSSAEVVSFFSSSAITSVSN